MVKSLTMTCPHCNQVSDIYLSTNACVIVLNCPSCYSPIMYFEKKMYLLSKKQVDAIRGTTQNNAVLKILDKIANPEPLIKSTDFGSLNQTLNPVISPRKIFYNLDDRKYISEDDITNLRIELAICNDSQAFIDKI